MKKLLIFLQFLFICNASFGQVRISNAQTLVCPNEETQYFTEPTSTNASSCIYTWKVTNGVFSNGLTEIIGGYASVNTVTVIWDNVVATSGSAAPKGTIEVRASGCPLPTGEIILSRISNIIIKILNNVNPSSISGSQNVNLGSTNNNLFNY